MKFMDFTAVDIHSQLSDEELFVLTEIITPEEVREPLSEKDQQELEELKRRIISDIQSASYDYTIFALFTALSVCRNSNLIWPYI